MFRDHDLTTKLGRKLQNYYNELPGTLPLGQGSQLPAQSRCFANKVLLARGQFIYILSLAAFAGTEELSNGHRDRVARKAQNIYYLALCRKNM